METNLFSHTAQFYDLVVNRNPAVAADRAPRLGRQYQESEKRALLRVPNARPESVPEDPLPRVCRPAFRNTRPCGRVARRSGLDLQRWR